MVESTKRIALVTGGSRGIGLAVVKKLVKEGVDVITCGRNFKNWESALENEPELVDVDFNECDLSKRDELESFFCHIRETYLRLDLAVNNASPAIDSSGMFYELSLDKLYHANLLSDLWVPIQCLRKEIELMPARSIIVNISSVNGLRSAPQAAVYSAAKHGLEGLTKSLAIEFIGRGIRINAVAPGVTMTPRWQVRFAQSSSPEGVSTEIEEQVPIKRFANPDEIASAVMWLLSEESSYVVGHTLVVDGGLSLV